MLDPVRLTYFTLLAGRGRAARRADPLVLVTPERINNDRDAGPVSKAESDSAKASFAINFG